VGQRSLDGRVALVTGASSGIGRATAIALARQGADVALAARRPDALGATADAVRAAGGQAMVVPTDVTDPSQVSNLVDEVLTQWRRIDILVACAGIYVRCPAQSLTAEHFEQSMATNFYGVLHPVLAVLPHMMERRSGHLVMLSSVDGKKGIPPDGPYVAAKFAVAGLADVLRQELAPAGVGVTAVFPGRVDTPMIADLQVPRISAKLPPDAVAQAIVKAIRRRQPEVIIPASGRLLWYVSVLSPSLGDWFVRRLKLAGW